MFKTPPGDGAAVNPMQVDGTPLTSQPTFIPTRGTKRKKVTSPVIQDVPDPLEFHKLQQQANESMLKIQDLICNSDPENTNTQQLEIIAETTNIRNILEHLFIAYNTVYTRVASEATSMEILEEINKNVKIIKENVYHGGAPQTTYANIASKNLAVKVPGVNKPVIPKAKPSVLIYPDETQKETMNSSLLTKQAVMRAIKPSTMGIRVEKVRDLRNAGICIELANEEDAKKLQAADTLGQIGVTSKLPGKRNPRIAIFNIPSECDTDTILDEICNQVPNTNRYTMRTVGKMGPRNKDTYHAIIECNNDDRKKIIEKGKLYLDWSACPIKDHISILQCFKCQEFGHVAEKCTSNKPTCRFCSSQDHDSKDCPEKTKADFKPQCALCKKFSIPNTEHIASDNKHCEIWKRRYMATLKSIDYES